MTAEFPTAPGRLPLLGHAHLVTGDPRAFLTSLPELGPVVRIYLGARPAYVLTTPETIREVSLGRAGTFHRDALRDAISELVSGATNVLSGTEHDVRRRMIAPAFRQGRLNEYAGHVATIADDWSAAFTAGDCGDLRSRVHELVTRTMFATLFRSDSGADEASFIQRRIPWLLGEVIIRGALPKPARRLRIIPNRRFVRQSGEVRTALRSLIDQRRQDTDRGDMLSALLHLPDDDLVDELLLALAASIGSQSSIFAWLIYETARAPQITERICAEVDSVVGTGPVRPEHASSLPFLRNVLMETLRVWAPWISMITSGGPVRIGATQFPDNTDFLFSPYMVHHQERHFRDAAVFDPDRWDGAAGDPQAMMPFGMGQRHCPGNHFALLSITLQAAALFARWRPALPDDFEVKVRGKDFVLSPAALPVTLTPR
ncbi:hypothetical protein ASE48_15395 [Mycobacterium sp. Root265]|uniref:cytochrome P450 n=1 Tax=Mycobacterium sp. Root265 TaxID=1736504 RepID=UPI00070A1999|nr:cytochrome P450 [Mycobacterium sp. Root265]KRD05575.1 hypothetical protein ASE48_15395 [Mycobacterium sp. Root265]